MNCAIQLIIFIYYCIVSFLLFQDTNNCFHYFRTGFYATTLGVKYYTLIVLFGVVSQYWDLDYSFACLPSSLFCLEDRRAYCCDKPV